MTAHPAGELATPHSFVSSAHIWRTCRPLSSKSLMKVLSSIGPSVMPWGKSLVTGLHVDFVLVITRPSHSDSFQSTSLSTYLTHTLLVCL